jgi:glycosyltransferase involved in cell wall biosynthesis
VRICLVSQEYPPETASGGIGSQTYLKAHGLARLRHEVVVISASPDLRASDGQDGPVRVIRTPGYHGRMPLNTEPARWVTYSAEVAATIVALHRRAPIDVVDFPEWACEGYVHLLNRTEWDSIPTVIQLHGPLVMFAHTMGWPDPESDFYRVGIEMERTCLRLADRIFSSGACSAEWCSRYYGLASASIPVLHTGVDTQLFRPGGTPKEQRPTVVFVGKIQPAKGVDLLVEAMCRIARDHPDVRLRLMGTGDSEYRRELRARAVAHGLPTLLDFAGFVPRTELPAQLNRAHVLAVPSRYEGGPGFVYLEAMACGLPVIACAGSGAEEVVRPEETGVLVAPDDPDELVAALAMLLANPARCTEMGQRGRAFVELEADTRVCSKQLEGFYRSVVEAATTGP